MNTTTLTTSKATAFLSALALLAGLAVAPALRADEYYWQSADSANTWNTTGANSYWNTNPDGSGTKLSGFANGDVFHSNGRAVATPAPGPSTFGDGASVTLVLSGGANDQLSVRANGVETNVATVSTLISRGGTIAAAIQNNNNHRLRVNTFIAEAATETTSGITYLNASTNSNNRTLQVSIGTLSGSGTFAISPNSGTTRPINLGVENASAYTGTFNFNTGIVHFTSNIVSGGSLILSGDAKLSTSNTDARSLTFNSVTIGGTALEARVDPYTFAELRNLGFSQYINATAIGTSSITVMAAIPEPSALAAIAGICLLAFAAGRRRRA